MKKLILSLILAVVALGMKAQIVTSNPPLLTNSSTGIVLTYHPDAAESNKALMGLPASTAIYAHIGLITDKSTSTSDWKFAPDWLDNSAKYKLTYTGPNTYTLNIGDFKTYFPGLGSDKVKRIAVVFRTATGDKEGKTMAGGDIFVDVYEEGFNIAFTSSVNDITSVGSTTNLNVATSEPASIAISVNGQQLAANTSATTLSASYKFAALGTYNFTATATNAAGKTVTKSISVVAPEASKAATYPGGTPKMGAVANADGSVTFCLAAPGKSSVILVPSWDDYAVKNENVMAYQDYNGNRYFWITVKGLDPSTPYPYYYIVDGTTKVGDPYARLVLDCYSDKFLDRTVWPDCPQYPYDRFDDVILAVYQGNLDTSYKFSEFTIPEHRNLMIYEMLFRDFTGTEGKAEGNGTVRQAIAKIPYLAELGVNAVELMPIMEFNGNNSWGYNTNFYFAPDKAYGSPKDYKDFVETCHRHGIAVILDIVFNQSDGLHPWYQMYPIASNPFYNENAPHAYSVLNDWRQDNPLVQQQWDDVLRYWMTAYNVDGFRFDLVKGLGDNASYGSNGNTEGYNQSRIDRMKRLHAVIKSVKPNGIHINENLAGADEETQMANDGQLLWANFNANSIQFGICQSEGSGGGKLNQLYTGYGRPEGSYIAYAESHDEERVNYRISNSAPSAMRSSTNAAKRLGMLAAHFILTPGPKMIWQFGELGANQTTKKGNDNNTDPKRVIWSNLDNPAYSGLHDVYRALLSLRRDNPDLFAPGATYTTSNLGGNATSPRTIILRNGNKEVICFMNTATSGAATTISARASVISASNNQLICASAGVTPTLSGSGNVTVSLPYNSMAVYASKEVTGIEDIFGDDFTGQNSVAVYGSTGEIHIAGEYTDAAAYTLDGRSAALTGLTPGLYIVVVDGNSYKVTVK
ncbi:MAG: alpha-amylase family glycosyl hydrolase [Odoribacter sp.]|nr:alpha-amylase family glycosyl hydrolase [Odoribacter sp.]